MGPVNLGPAVAAPGEQEAPGAGVGPDRLRPGPEDAVLYLRSTHLMVIGPLNGWLERRACLLGASKGDDRVSGGVSTT